MYLGDEEDEKEEKKETSTLSSVRSSGGSVRTVFVFLDLPRHIEFQAGELPLIPEGTVVQFDIPVRNPRDTKKTRNVTGPYRVARGVLRYSTSRVGSVGMTQYLEWEPVP